jgi:hypothetical protein
MTSRNSSADFNDDLQSAPASRIPETNESDSISSLMRRFGMVATLLAGGVLGAGGALVMQESGNKDARLKAEFRDLVTDVMQESLIAQKHQMNVLEDRGVIWSAVQENDVIKIAVLPGMPGKRPLEALWSPIQSLAEQTFAAKGEKFTNLRIASMQIHCDPTTMLPTSVFVICEGHDTTGVLIVRENIPVTETEAKDIKTRLILQRGMTKAQEEK